ncbi:MAG: hypothetical protein PHV74_14935 [Dehalococcoidia bacterium]|nr:hypothetical protein [Dehalococcoidia bacterium]
MGRPKEFSFKTDTGTCIITPDKLLLERHEPAGRASNGVNGKITQRRIVIYAFSGIAAVIIGGWLLTQEDIAMGCVFSLIGIFLIWNVFSSRRDSAAAVIERSDILSIEAHPPLPLTRGYIAVNFMENGRRRQRSIMLSGKQEYQEALQAMRDAGLLDQE